MDEVLTEREVELLKHLGTGGIVAVRVYGKKALTMEIATSPKNINIGLMSIAKAEDSGLIKSAAQSPYKNGKSTPYVLTQAGTAAWNHRATQTGEQDVE